MTVPSCQNFLCAPVRFEEHAVRTPAALRARPSQSAGLPRHASEIRPYSKHHLRLSYLALIAKNTKRIWICFVKLTTGSNQWIGKFQIIWSERASGVRIRGQKRETLFSKQHWLGTTSFLAYFELDRERENSKPFGCETETEYRHI